MSRVSVIITVYNSESTILDVLHSVLQQTAISQIKEIIIIDDGSVDNSSIIIKDFIKKTYIQNLDILYYYQENQGASAARNRGMHEATAEFIALLDSDDLWMPNKIERQLQILDENPHIYFLGTSFYVGPNKKKSDLILRGKKIDKLFKAELDDIYWRHFPVTPSVIFRRIAIDTIGYFDNSQKYVEDINYFQKFCIKFNYYYLPEYLVHVGYNKKFFGSKGLSSNFKGMHKGELKNLNELFSGGHISKKKYLYYRIFIELKYWRRIIIRKINRFNCLD